MRNDRRIECECVWYVAWRVGMEEIKGFFSATKSQRVIYVAQTMKITAKVKQRYKNLKVRASLL